VSALSDILTAPGLKADMLDALQTNLMPLLTRASQEELANVFFLAHRLVDKLAAGDEEGAAASRRHIKVIEENLEIEFVADVKNTLASVALSLLSALTAGAFKGALGGIGP